MGEFEVRKYRTDVLIVGGGIAGLAAAIRARRHGAEVIVLEKSHTERSGNAGSGIDHIQSYVPEVHEKVGYTENDMVNEQVNWSGNTGNLQRRDLIEIFVRNSAKDVIELEQYGLKFRFEESNTPRGYRLVPQFHFVPTSYNFEGRDIKRVLTDKALELGAVIVNRVHVRELLTDGGAVTGAVGLGTREPVITVVTAKTTVLATSGRATRLTGSVTAFDKFEWYSAPSAANGSGKVLAARAGAEVVNLEFVALADSYNLHNYSFSVGLPSGSWWPAGRIVDEDGNVVVRRNRDLPLDDPDYKAKYHLLVEDYQRQRATIVPLLKQGKSLYFDLLEATDEERERILWALGHEGKTGVLKHHLEKRNIDLRTARFPLRLGQRRDALGNGIWVKDATTETSVRNLYATGNELPGTGIGGGGEALVIGFATGEQAAARAKETELPKDVSALCVAELKKQVAEIFGSENGDEWQSGERALQVLLESYLGKPYTENALKQLGLLLHRLSADLKLRADNLHQLNRVLEVIDLYRLAELVAVAARERKSSLGLFRRSDEADYPREEEGTFIGVSWKNGAVKASRLSNPTT